MQIQQLIFQGVLGQPSAARLKFADTVNRVSLPGGVTVDEARALLLNLLYPADCADAERDVVERGEDPKLALLIRSGSRTCRLICHGSPDSIRLQGRRDGSWKTATAGAADVASALDQRLGRPPLRIFRALNLWDFDGAARESPTTSFDPEAIGPEAVEMVEEYQQAVELDELEAKIERVEQRIGSLRDNYGKAFDVQQRLEQAREQLDAIDLTAVDEDDLEMLADRRERLEAYRRQLDELDDDEREERQQVEALEPQPPWRKNELWIGAAVGVAAVLVSFLSGEMLRWVILLDTVGFGMVAWILLRYLTDREKVNIHKVRIESIKRRTAEVRREMVQYQEQVDHILVHADADSEGELLNRYQKRERLESLVDELEQKAEKLEGNEQFRRAREELEELEGRHRELTERREQLPEFVPDMFRIENELQALGVDPNAVARAKTGVGQGDPDHISAFEILADLADRFGYRSGGQLDGKSEKLWHKMIAHIFGDEFRRLEIGEDGQLHGPTFAEADDLETWQARHPDETRILAGTLAVALHVRSTSRDRRIETVCLEEPRDRFPAALAEGLTDVIGGAARGAHFALLSGS